MRSATGLLIVRKAVRVRAVFPRPSAVLPARMVYDDTMAIAYSPEPSDVKVLPASAEQEPILANLLELYIHDFGEFIDVRLAPDGRYGYPTLPSYWTQPAHYPFLITADSDLAGFALVQRGSQISGDPDIWDLTEFFVVRSLRRRGVGTRAAHRLWQTLPGRWEVRVIDLNQKAVEFWAHAIQEFVGQPVVPTQYEKDGFARHLFSFESAPATA
jgi:predicted acetyltransferase